MWYDKTNVVFYKDSHNKRNKMFRKEFYIWKRSIHRNGNKTCQHLKKRQTSFMQENEVKQITKDFPVVTEVTVSYTHLDVYKRQRGVRNEKDVKMCEELAKALGGQLALSLIHI